MAAIVLESLAVPRSGAAQAPAASRTAAALGAVPLGRRRRHESGPLLLLLPQFKGLRAASSSSSRVPNGAAVAAPTRAVRRRAAVVSEAQETALQLPAVGKDTWQSLVLDSDVPVLVDYWAPWCGPCRMIEPCLVKLAKAYEGKLKCYKLNTDENPDIATQYGIRSIPTMMIFKGGEKKEAVIGAVPESTLITSIEKYVER